MPGFLYRHFLVPSSAWYASMFVISTKAVDPALAAPAWSKYARMRYNRRILEHLLPFPAECGTASSPVDMSAVSASITRGCSE